jgi:hypothetical protein
MGVVYQMKVAIEDRQEYLCMQLSCGRWWSLSPQRPLIRYFNYYSSARVRESERF